MSVADGLFLLVCALAAVYLIVWVTDKMTGGDD